MNEKIKQLQNTAGIQVVRTLMRGDENTEVKLMLTQTQLDRFAELIVRECIKTVDKVYDEETGMGEKLCRRATPYQEIIEEIADHFGVEE
jgi:hypothetical protein